MVAVAVVNVRDCTCCSDMNQSTPQLEPTACEVVVVVRVLAQLCDPEEPVKPCHLPKCQLLDPLSLTVVVTYVAEGPDVPCTLCLQMGVIFMLRENSPLAVLLSCCLQHPAAEGLRIPRRIMAQEICRRPHVPPLHFDRNRLHRLRTSDAPLHYLTSVRAFFATNMPYATHRRDQQRSGWGLHLASSWKPSRPPLLGALRATVSASWLRS